MGNCCSTPEPDGSQGQRPQWLQEKSLPPMMQNEQYKENEIVSNRYRSSKTKLEAELDIQERIKQMQIPLETLPILSHYLDLQSFLALRMTCLSVYRVLTPMLWKYVHLDIRQVAEPTSEASSLPDLTEWPVTKRVGMPNELWQSARFQYEDKTVERYIRLDMGQLQELAKTILKGRLSRALTSIECMSIFLVPQTPINVTEHYVDTRLAQEVSSQKNIVEIYKTQPKLFIDVFLAQIINPQCMPNIQRFDVVLRGYEAFSDRVLSQLFSRFPDADQHLYLNDLTGLYYTGLNSSCVKTLVISVSSTIWSSVQRTFKSESPVLPQSIEYFEINRKWMRPESKMAELPLTDQRMRKLLSKVQSSLKTLRIHTFHELDEYDWIPNSVVDLSVEDGDENPQYITRARVSLPNVKRLSVTTPYGAIFRKLHFTNLEHLQVGDLDSCECLGPIISSNPKLHTLLMGDSEGTGLIWNVVLRNSVAISTLMIEGEPIVFDPYSNPKELKLPHLDTMGLTVLAEPEQVEPVLQEVLSRTPHLRRLYLRCESLDQEYWDGCITKVKIGEVEETEGWGVVGSGGTNSGGSGKTDDESIDSREELQAYVVNIAQCRLAFDL